MKNEEKESLKINTGASQPFFITIFFTFEALYGKFIKGDLYE
jgi:hypothetical protein